MVGNLKVTAFLTLALALPKVSALGIFDNITDEVILDIFQNTSEAFKYEICVNWPFELNTNRPRLNKFFEATEYMTSEPPPPFPGQNITDISVSVVVEEVDSFSDKKMGMQLALMIGVSWTDIRLRLFEPCLEILGISREMCPDFKKKFLSPKSHLIMWFPNLKFMNTVKMEDREFYEDPVPPVMNPCTGYVSFMKSVSIGLKCPTDYSWYPFDAQTCDLGILLLNNGYSFGHFGPDLQTEMVKVASMPSKVMLKWGKAFLTKSANLNKIGDWHESVDLISNTSEQNRFQARGGNLLLSFHFVRSHVAYYVQSFIPSTMLVTASLLSMWVPSNQVPGRMALTITITLTLVAMMNTEIDKMPKTAYLKAMDIWMLACFTFSFLVLTHFCAILTLTLPGPDWMTAKIGPIHSKECEKKKADLANRINLFGKMILPTSFALFVIVFFSLCVMHESIEHEDGAVVTPLKPGLQQYFNPEDDINQ